MSIFPSYIKRLICILIIPFAVSFVSARDFVVVIDAGHGGKDYGAIGKYSNEKTITLSVVKLLGKKIQDNCDNVKVVYTRSTDKFLSLQERANVANKAAGDLFISIHVNSVAKRTKGRDKISGASVYTLGLHRSAENLEVAKRENAVIELEDDYSSKYSGFNPNSSESYIIFELSQNKHMQQSIKFANAVQHELLKTAERKDKGVRQAGFWVLWATSMPSVLIELDFICNPTQEKFLASKKGQEKLSDAIFNAFKEYKEAYLRQLETTHSSGNKTENFENPVSTDDDVITYNVPIEEQQEYSNKEKDSKIRYKIQILTSPKKIEKGSRQFKGLYPVNYYFEKGVYKYTYESMTSRKEAQKILKKVKQKFPQAFIIITKGNKRIK